MQINLNGLQPSWFTPTIGNTKKKPARVRIKPLTSVQMLQLVDKCRILNGEAIMTWEGRVAALRQGVDDWEGFTSGKPAEPVPFSTEALMKLDYQILIEISSEIFAASTLTDEQKKA